MNGSTAARFTCWRRQEAIAHHGGDIDKLPQVPRRTERKAEEGVHQAGFWLSVVLGGQIVRV